MARLLLTVRCPQQYVQLNSNETPRSHSALGVDPRKTETSAAPATTPVTYIVRSKGNSVEPVTDAVTTN